MALETTATLEETTVDTLQDLVTINIDARDGFREAAENISVPELASEFRTFAAERDRQAEELKMYVEMNDETPPSEGSFAAKLHRCWINFRDALTSDDVQSVLDEAERGEDTIKAAYESALKDSAGSAVNDVLQQHYTQVKAVHDRVRDLRDARRAAS